MISLISIGDLITHGLKDIQSTWKPTLKYTMWFFLGPIIFTVVMVPASLSISSGTEPSGAVLGLFGFGYLMLFLGLIWASIALMHYMMEHVKGHDMAKWKPKNAAITYLPSMLWVAILTTLPILAAWIIASLPLLVARDSGMAGILMALLFIAALVFSIWIGVSFSQAYLFILADEVRGIEALKRSYKLVLGQWWKVLWRLFVPNLVFQIILGMIMGLFYAIIFFIGFVLFGGWIASLGATQEMGLETARASNVGFGFLGIVFVLLIGVSAFLLTTAQVIAQAIFQASVGARLFFSLKHTKTK